MARRGSRHTCKFGWRPATGNQVKATLVFILYQARLTTLAPSSGSTRCKSRHSPRNDSLPVSIRQLSIALPERLKSIRGQFFRAPPHRQARPWRSSRGWNVHAVVSSGAGSLPRSIPIEPRIEVDSYNTFSTVGPDKSNHCGRR